MLIGDRAIVDVDLAPILLELVGFASDEPADDGIVASSEDDRDMLLGRQTDEIVVVRRFRSVALRVRESLAE